MNRQIKYRVVPNRWLEKAGYRLDCGPYMSGAIEAKELLKKHITIPLKDLTFGYHGGIFNGPRFPRTYVDDPYNGVPFLGSTDILSSDLSFLPLLSKKQIEKNPALVLDEGWSLITCSGTIGRMAYSRSGMKGLAGSQHFMRVVPDIQKIKPGYLYAYLSSRFGLPIVLSGTYGAIIQHIEPHHIEDLPVPRLGNIEGQSHHLIEESSDLLTDYENRISEATQLYFDSVGLSDITASEWHSWGSDLGFSTTGKVQTLRALNYNPRFNRLCERIKQGPWKTLSEICVPGTLKRGPRFSRIDAEPEAAYQMIGQKQIFWLRPEGRWIAKKSVGNEVLVPDGTILVAAQGTLGENELFCRSEFITGSLIERAYSEHLLRIISDENMMQTGALYAFIRSETAFRMFRSSSTGSKLQDFHYDVLPSLPIPYPPEDIRNRCNQLITEAYASREKAIELEDQARTLVENAIQEGAR